MSQPMTPDLAAIIQPALNPSPAPATEPAAARATAMHPICLHCPHCGNEEANVAVLLGQLDCQQFRCEECNTEFSIEDMEAMIGRWQAVIAWVKSVPQLPDAE